MGLEQDHKQRNESRGKGTCAPIEVNGGGRNDGSAHVMQSQTSQLTQLNTTATNTHTHTHTHLIDVRSFTALSMAQLIISEHVASDMCVQDPGNRHRPSVVYMAGF
jgi:hypothetical protein